MAKHKTSVKNLKDQITNEYDRYEELFEQLKQRFFRDVLDDGPFEDIKVIFKNPNPYHSVGSYGLSFSYYDGTDGPIIMFSFLAYTQSGKIETSRVVKLGTRKIIVEEMNTLQYGGLEMEFSSFLSQADLHYLLEDLN